MKISAEKKLKSNKNILTEMNIVHFSKKFFKEFVKIASQFFKNNIQITSGGSKVMFFYLFIISQVFIGVKLVDLMLFHSICDQNIFQMTV